MFMYIILLFIQFWVFLTKKKDSKVVVLNPQDLFIKVEWKKSKVLYPYVKFIYLDCINLL